MTKTEDRNAAEDLIDLGAATEQTKGNVRLPFDGIQGHGQLPMGLAND